MWIIFEEKRQKGLFLTQNAFLQISKNLLVAQVFIFPVEITEMTAKGFLIILRTAIIATTISSARMSQSPLQEIRSEPREFHKTLKCPSKKLEDLSEIDKNLIQDEYQIARDGHLSGFRPLFYDIQLKVMNFEEFGASVTILIKSVKPTSTVIINFDANALKVSNENDIRLKLLKLDSKESSSFNDLAKNVEREICFNETLKSVTKESLLIMDVHETLHAGRLFLLEIHNYRGRVYNRHTGMTYGQLRNLPPSSFGLRRTDPKLPSAALSTLFQMRHARTVFPCFDHPIFKTNISVCIEHSKSTVALSNTVSQSTEDKNDSVIDCFKVTPKIPIYVFTFSILENFTSVEESKGSTSIEIYYPADEPAGRFSWEKEYTSEVLTYVKHNFDVELGVDRLAFLNLRPCIMWGIENYGLISVDANQMMDNKKELSRTILVHEIVHQWLGDDATISNWDEICLQEGLTAYLEGSISDALNFSMPLKNSVAQKIAYLINGFKRIISAPIRKFNVTQDIANHCFGYPFVVFYMMREAYGEELWTSFLKILFKEHHFGTANFTRWIQILDEIAPVSANKTMSAGQFLHKWFTQDGYPVSYVRINGDKVDIIQRAIYGKEDWYTYYGVSQYIANASGFRPVLYKVVLGNDGDSIEKDIFVDNKNFTLGLSSNIPKWIILDPAGVTLTRVLYEPEIYMGIITCFTTGQNCPITTQHFKRIFNDFCFAFSQNGIFSSYEEKSPSNLNVTAWDTLLATLYDLSDKKTIDLPRQCSCCFKPKSLLIHEPSRYGSCKSAWNSYCKDQELMVSIGRDYTL
uniref:Aminopeptidase n=1 Tax=Romanomermis culicivorax TaxID=13658 RepID=A0A915I3T1_ROMCU